MWKKLLILSLSIAVLFVLSAPITPANAGSKNVDWNVVGSIANNVEVSVNINPPGQTPLFVDIPHYLINISAKGSPGPAEITLMGYGSPVPNYMDNDHCDTEPNIIQINPVVNDMVARFSDQSLLFASFNGTSPGYLCLDTAAGHSTFLSNMVIIGGTGRFEGATGTITGTGDGYYFPSGGPLAGEVGKMTGEIILP